MLAINDNSNVRIVSTCPFCGKTNRVVVSSADYESWKNGTPAQIAFTYLTASDRELLISGICDECWPAEE